MKQHAHIIVFVILFSPGINHQWLFQFCLKDFLSCLTEMTFITVRLPTQHATGEIIVEIILAMSLLLLIKHCFVFYND